MSWFDCQEMSIVLEAMIASNYHRKMECGYGIGIQEILVGEAQWIILSRLKDIIL